MQYLLTEEEFKSSVPASAIEPFLIATQDYYRRKDTHLGECLLSARDDYARSLHDAITGAVSRHRREWTEKPPEPKDFIKTKQ